MTKKTEKFNRPLKILAVEICNSDGNVACPYSMLSVCRKQECASAVIHVVENEDGEYPLVCSHTLTNIRGYEDQFELQAVGVFHPQEDEDEDEE